MSFGLAFWILMLLWFVSAGLYWNGSQWAGNVGSVIGFLLFVLLGWAVFGAPIR
jgi:hypothetical protein